jgi:hypothetical protein
MFDIFGKRDPRKMPSQLFASALHLDYSTAVRADTAKQNHGVCPRYWYVDAAFRCARCSNPFVFSAEEQRVWYEELGFYVDSRAKHCRACRLQLRELKALRQEYDREVATALAAGSSLDGKKRLLDVLEALDAGGVSLPDKIRENRRVLMEQVAASRSAIS